MIEALNRLKDADYYCHETLAALGFAFINNDPQEPSLILEIPLIELGIFVIQKLKNQATTINQDVLYDIALAKRWDTTERKGKFWQTLLTKSHHYYLNKLEARFKQSEILSVVGKVFEQNYEQASYTEIANNITMLGKEEAHIYGVNKFNELDKFHKISELARILEPLTDAYKKYPIIVMQCYNQLFDVSSVEIQQFINNFNQAKDDNDYHNLTAKILNKLGEELTIFIDQTLHPATTNATSDIESLSDNINQQQFNYCTGMPISLSKEINELLCDSLVETQNAMMKADFALNTLTPLRTALISDQADQQATLKPLDDYSRVITESRDTLNSKIAELRKLKEQQEKIENTGHAVSEYELLVKRFTNFYVLKQDALTTTTFRFAEDFNELQHIRNMIHIWAPEFFKTTDIDATVNTFMLDKRYMNRALLQGEQMLEKLDHMEARLQELEKQWHDLKKFFAESIAICAEMHNHEKHATMAQIFTLIFNQQMDEWRNKITKLSDVGLKSSLDDLKFKLHEVLSSLKRIKEDKSIVESKNLTPPRDLPLKRKFVFATDSPVKFQPNKRPNAGEEKKITVQRKILF
jgi:hypothetical protein